MGLAADLIRYDHELTRQHADEELREGIDEELDEIRKLTRDLSFENLIEARGHAQKIIDMCNTRLPY